MTPHWTSLHVERFRRLRDLKLDDLGPINLLVGKNNSGKTSVLEALSVLSHPLSAFTWIDTARERELKSSRTPVLETLGWLFPHDQPRSNGFAGEVCIRGVKRANGATWQTKATYKEYRQTGLNTVANSVTSMEIEAEDEQSEYVSQLDVVADELLRDGRRILGGQESFKFSGSAYAAATNESARFHPCQLVTPVSHRTNSILLQALDRVIRQDSDQKLVRLLKLLAPDVEDIAILDPEGRRSVVEVKHQGVGFVPLAMEGDGMRRTLAIAAAISLAKDGVLLVDEVETALHPEAIRDVFAAVVQMCQVANVQLFVTTHSLEAVDAMLASVENPANSLVAYHLPPRNSSQSVVRLGGKSIRDMRRVGGLDLR